ncbi:hypothetical protein [Streptomyces sp. NPDC057623]|uniref:hypothetical protein n=1 Tax=Streptomyces sp. NPDC057623 TaxID=3346187 RepID=UPI0036921A5E
MPFEAGEIRWDRMCAPGPGGHWRAWITVHVEGRALWRLGLHPGQATAVVNGPSPPGWWHAAGERYARGRSAVRRVS